MLAIAPLAANAQAPAATTQGVTPELAADLSRFLSWFGGEWNNNEQVWQQKVDSAKLPGGKPEEPITHTHHIFAPVKAPKIGTHTFYVQQSLDADMSKAYRQRLYRITADAATQSVKLEIFAFLDDKAFFNAQLKPDLFTELDTTRLRATPGCEVYWRYRAATQEFEGTMPANACVVNSVRLGKKIFISDTLKLTQGEIWINDQARDEQGGHVFGSKSNTPVKNRKVRYFSGWVFGTDPSTGKKLLGKRDLMIHNEGQKLSLNFEDGTPSPYTIELAQLTYQNTTAPILKMALIDSSDAKRGAYTWANVEATRVGLNMGWIQFGLTQKPVAAEFGFMTATK